MGSGSTKNERKANAQRVEVNRELEKKLLQERKKLLSLPCNQRPPNYDALVEKLNGKLRRARSKQKRSENDTQTGKRGAR
jgi:hypothetical protein